MRTTRTTQTSLFDPNPVDHQIADLERLSAWLDAQPELTAQVESDLDAGAARGRDGLSCETVLRCALLMHPPGDVPGAGVPAAGLAVGAALRTRRHGAPAGQVGAAGDDLGELEADQPAATRGRTRRGDRDRGAGPRGQHGDQDGHPGAGRQPAAVRRRARVAPRPADDPEQPPLRRRLRALPRRRGSSSARSSSRVSTRTPSDSSRCVDQPVPRYRCMNRRAGNGSANVGPHTQS